MNGWYAFDLDGTLAEYNGWVNERHIGKPIPKMVAKAKELIAAGKDVRIFTARVSGDRQGIAPGETATIIQDWTEEHLGKRLPVTATKDFGMICLYDDRAIQVFPNEGTVLEESYDQLMSQYIEQEFEVNRLKSENKRLMESRLELAKQ